MADIINSLIGEQATQLEKMFCRVSENALLNNAEPTAKALVEWEEYLVNQVKQDRELPETEREAVIVARRGQGIFKKNVMQMESCCRITKVDNIEHLIASHIKPWRDCTMNSERLMGSNGLLLTPSIDHLFDRGFISFEDNGSLMISPAAQHLSLERMGVVTDRSLNVGSFNQDQKRFLNYHREQVFLESRK